jgi:hypothetical protein
VDLEGDISANFCAIAANYHTRPIASVPCISVVWKRYGTSTQATVEKNDPRAELREIYAALSTASP